MSRVQLVDDEPTAFTLQLPERLNRAWVVGLTLPPGPRPVLADAEDVDEADDDGLDALAERLCGRRVGYLRLPPTLLVRLAPRVAALAEMLDDGAA